MPALYPQTNFSFNSLNVTFSKCLNTFITYRWQSWLI
jgi:hypothetical protein